LSVFPYALTLAVALFTLTMPASAEVSIPLGGGFRTDASVPDAYYVECQASKIELVGMGGVVRAMTTEKVSDTGIISALVVAEYAPALICRNGELIIFSSDEDSLIYLSAAAAEIAFVD
jgi:hypothetical protein